MRLLNVLTKIDLGNPLCATNAKRTITMGIVPTKVIDHPQAPQAPLTPNMLLCNGCGVEHLYKDGPMRRRAKPTMDAKTTGLLGDWKG